MIAAAERRRKSYLKKKKKQYLCLRSSLGREGVFVCAKIIICIQTASRVQSAASRFNGLFANLFLLLLLIFFVNNLQVKKISKKLFFF